MGILSGFVRDYKGDLLPGATLHFIRRDTGVKVKTLTTSTGSTFYPDDPFFNNVVLLIEMTGVNGETNFIDSSLRSKTISNQNTVMSNLQSRFGTTSARFTYFSANNISIQNDSDFHFGSEPFTIEFWIYPVSFGSQWTRPFFSQRVNSFEICPIYMSLDPGGIVGIAISNSNVSFWQTFHQFTGVACSLNVWSHLAIVGNGSSVRCFVNGVMSTNFASYTTIPAPTQAIRIGNGQNDLMDSFDGFMDGIRITKGIARYTSNFTPESIPFFGVGSTMTTGGYYYNTSEVNSEFQIIALSEGAVPNQNDTIIRVTPTV